MGIGAANLTASGISEGRTVEFIIALDEERRTVSEPPDLSEALNWSAQARAAFDKLPFGVRRKHIAAIEVAKSAETRQRRNAKRLSKLQKDSS